MVTGKNCVVRWCLCGALMLLALPSWAATISVKSDRNPVAINESFRLIFEADGRVDDDPDFTALEQSFEIRSQSQGTTMQIVNGSVSQARQWTLVLMPKRSGRLVVPAIPFGKDKSQPLVIGVTEQVASAEAANNSVLFIEVSAESASGQDEAYVQSQVIYKARLFRAVNVANATLSEPEISDADAVIEKLGDDREFETTRGGRRYVVLERSYAIFPQQSGTLTISPLTFEGQVVNRSRGMFDVFEQGGQIRRVNSEGLSLNIKAVPPTEGARQWLPAREMKLVEEWPEGVDLSKAVIAGEPLTWTLTLIADGLTAAQLPTITPTMPEGIKAYPDQARQMNDKKQDTLLGVRQEKIALIPTRAGEYQLPAISIPWWNSRTGQREVVSLPARKLNVVAADAANTPVSSAPMMDDVDLSVSETASGLSSGSNDSSWRIVSGLLAVGWFLTAIAWIVTRRKNERSDGVPNEAAAPDFSAAKKALQIACAQNDTAAAKEAMLGWAALRWPENRPGSLAEIAQRVDEPLSLELTALNRQLYSCADSTSAAGWNGSGLWQVFKVELSHDETVGVTNKPILAPMHP